MAREPRAAGSPRRAPSAASLLPAPPRGCVREQRELGFSAAGRVIQTHAPRRGARADTKFPGGTASCSSAPVTGRVEITFQKGLGEAGSCHCLAFERGQSCCCTLAVRIGAHRQHDGGNGTHMLCDIRNGAHRQRGEGPWSSTQTWSSWRGREGRESPMRLNGHMALLPFLL